MLNWIRERAWVPATLLLVAGAGGIGLLDASLREPIAWVSVIAGALLLAGFARRYRQGQPEPAKPARSKERPSLKVIQGGKAIPYDLEKDESTNNQRYLM